MEDQESDDGSSVETRNDDERITVLERQDNADGARAQKDEAVSTREGDGNDETSDNPDGLSEYERLRMERIKRNQAYLSQLGLEDAKPKAEKRKRPQKRKSAPESMEPVRSSGRQRKSINYTEPSNSVARLFTGQSQRVGGVKPHKPRTPRSGASQELLNSRQEMFIFREFQRMRTHKKNTVRQMERIVRMAHKEVGYWQRQVEVYHKRHARRIAQEKLEQAAAEERASYGGCTLRELLHETDTRMPELLAAAAKYDDYFQAGTRAMEREKKRLEDEQQMVLLDALDRFPKVYKSCVSLLNSVLISRIPNDPPPPRRSSRASLEAAPSMLGGQGSEDAEESSPQPDSWRKHTIVSSENVFPTTAEPDQQAKSRKRCARNVGGWISPNFAETLDRSWLENDSFVTHFDPRTFVPQVGDTVLYYPAGHRQFLERYPDVLGKKTRSSTRVPLWERAVLEREKEGESPSSRWWREEWIEGEDNGAWNYPILCRVERTHAEFPPDPFVKVTRKDEQSGMVQVLYKAPSGKGPSKQWQGNTVRLAVGLRPLASVVPPVWGETGPRDESDLSIPPRFSVITFPCELKPFLVPFSWAYACSHTLAVNRQATPLIGCGKRYSVKEFTTLGSETGSFRLSDKPEYISSLLDACPTELSLMALIQDESLKAKHALPIRDALTVYEVIRQLASNDERASDEPTDTGVNFLAFVRASLPLWDSAVATPAANSRITDRFCPWELVPTSKGLALFDTTFLRRDVCLERALRDKIEFIIENFLSEDPSAVMFEKPVLDDDAPSYSCAVPVSMSLSKIQARARTQRGADRCFYRSCEALDADLNAITENCLLYNSPESSVVETAVDVMNRLRDSIAKMAQEHFKALNEARKGDELRRRHDLGADTADLESERNAPISTLRVPFRGELCRSWLLDGAAIWVPQVGDTIQYSKTRHERFIEYHSGSLRAEQRQTVDMGDDPAVPEWFDVVVCWSRPIYPKSSVKKEAVNGAFVDSTPLLSLGVRTESYGSIVLYWRPCLLVGTHGTNEDKENNVCPCGMSGNRSFIREKSSEDESVSNGTDQEVLSVSSLGRNEERCDVLDRVFCALRARCIKDVTASFVDPQLSRTTVKSGSRPPEFKSFAQLLPEHGLLTNGIVSKAKKKAHGTRGIPRKESEEEKNRRDALNKSGYVPHWLHAEKSTRAAEKEDCATAMPLPELCLGLIHRKLREGHYRHTSAIENEVIEAFVSVCVLSLKDFVRAKQCRLSAKRVCRLAGSSKALPTEGTSSYTDTEVMLADHLRNVRDLYSTALVAVLFPSHTAALFGVVLPEQAQSQLPQTEDPEEDPERAIARQKLDLFLSAIGREQHRNKFEWLSPETSLLPSLSVQLTCGGKVITHTEKVLRYDYCVADIDDQAFIVRPICEGKPFTAYGAIPEDDLIDDGKVVRMTRTAVPIEPTDLANSTSLQRFFFGRPGLMEPCARCRVYCRSFMVCRVRKGHSNVDFDWAAVFKDVGGIDGLLRALHPSDANDETANSSESVAMIEEEQKEAKQREDEEADPRTMLANAEEALQRSRDLLSQATVYAEAPPRLEKQFVHHTFPFDPADGHFVYCVVCGLTGDLLCCDGCPNVMHSKCISMDQVVENDDDWFCEECEKEGRSPRVAAVADSQTTPFGRVSFDDEACDALLVSLQSIREARPEAKAVAKKAKEDSGPSEPEDEAYDDSQGDVNASPAASHSNYHSDNNDLDDQVDSSTRRRSRRGLIPTLRFGYESTDQESEPSPAKPVASKSPPRKRGRPRQKPNDDVESDASRRQGRPRKAAIEVKSPSPRGKRGRPSKNEHDFQEGQTNDRKASPARRGGRQKNKTEGRDSVASRKVETPTREVRGFRGRRRASRTDT